MATADWLRGCAAAAEGAEIDLEKAFDQLDRTVVEYAHTCSAVSKYVVATMRAAWKGPRLMHVDGEVAESHVWPLRSLAQGDATAPAGMVAALFPWTPAGVDVWKFVDDRSILGKYPGSVETALSATTEFDRKIGARENLKKRQTWSRGERTRIEHVGFPV
eukprot:11080129-Alexandrium_andersonii.AAC.1